MCMRLCKGSNFWFWAFGHNRTATPVAKNKTSGIVFREKNKGMLKGKIATITLGKKLAEAEIVQAERWLDEH